MRQPPLHFRLAVGLLLSLCTLAGGIARGQGSRADTAADAERVLAKADSLRRAGSYARALDAVSQLSLGADRLSDWQAGRYLKLLGDIDSQKRRLGRARERYRRAQASLRRADHAEAESMALTLYVSIAMAYFREGDGRTALDTLNFARAVATEAGPAGARAIDYINRNSSVVSEAIGDYDGAARAARATIATLRARGDTLSRSIGFAYNSLGVALQRLGDNAGANREYTRAYASLRRIYGDEHAYVQSARGNIATTFYASGQADRAIPYYVRKIELLERDPATHVTEIVNTYINLMVAYQPLGEYDKALEAGYHALALWRDIGPDKHRREGTIYRALSSVQRGLGDYRTALATLDNAGKLYLAAGDTTGRDFAGYLERVGDIYALLRQDTDALAYHRRAYEAFEKLGPLFNLRLRTPHRAYVRSLLRVGDTTAAAQVVRELKRRLAMAPDSVMAGERAPTSASLDMLSAEVSLGMHPRAPLSGSTYVALEAAGQYYLDQLYALSGYGYRRNASQTLSNLNAALVSLVESNLRAARAEPEARQRHLRTAVELIETRRSYLRPSARPDRDLRGVEADTAAALRRRLAAYGGLLADTRLLGEQSFERAATYRDSISALESRLAQLTAGVGPASRTLRTPIRLEDLPSEGSVLIVYDTDEQLNLFHLSRRRISHAGHRITPALLDLVKQYTDYVAQPGLGFRESSTALTAGSQLARLVFAPLDTAEDRGNLRDLAVVQASSTLRLPLGALPLAAPQPGDKFFRDIPFAINAFDLSYHSTVNECVTALDANSTLRLERWVGVAPVGDGADTLVTQDVEALPYAGAEVRRLAALLEGRTLAGSEATPARLESEAQRTDVLHLATHAKANPKGAEYSYLLLAGDTTAAPSRLYGRTIRALDIPVQLLTLSACETGQGELTDGEGELNMASLFLEAGARSVVNTRWRIEDKRAITVTEALYSNIDAGQGVARALANAQRAYLASSGGQYGHPFYWAGFQVTGDVGSGGARDIYLWLLALLPLVGVAVFLARR